MSSAANDLRHLARSLGYVEERSTKHLRYVHPDTKAVVALHLGAKLGSKALYRNLAGKLRRGAVQPTTHQRKG